MEEATPQNYNFLDVKAIKDMDLALMSKFGFTSLNDVANANIHIIKNYLKIICNIDGCDEYCINYSDFFELDDRRRSCHNAISSAFNIPKKLVSIAAETLTNNTDCYTYYNKTKSFDNILIMFVQRLIELKYELMIENKHQELIKRYSDINWVELSKETEDLCGIPNLTSS
jgi:hypothetical protein